MTNEYFNHNTNRISPGTRAVAEQVNDIADEIVLGFDKLPTEAELKQGKLNYAADTGAADAYVITLSYTPTLSAGLAVSFQAANDNTGPSTLNVNALGAKSILSNAGSELAAGQISVGQIIELRYDGTAFRIMATDVPATGIKAIYESNADTNAFTDAEQTKVGHLTVTGAVDLDAMSTKLAGIENGATADQAWGEIGGTLSNQSDLQTALDGKSATTHNHDATYSQLGHNHNSSYLAIGGGSTMTGNNTVNDGWAWYFGTGQDMSIYHTSDQSFVRNTTGALTIENTGGAINIDVEVNDGTGYLKAFDTVGNPHTCLSWGNGSGDEPSLALHYDNTEVARTTTLANGGLLVNSKAVLTKESVASNHKRGGNVQIITGHASQGNLFTYTTAVTEVTWESCGPTGSGATNIISDMDDIPAGSGVAIFTVKIQMTSTLSSYSRLYIRPGDSSNSAGNETIVFEAAMDPDNSEAHTFFGLIFVPLDSSRTFDLYWDANNTTAHGGYLTYRGFISD